MLAGLTWLLVFQCLGEVIVRLVGLPVPGPVVGMLLLFVALRTREKVPAAIDGAATGLLQHLSLLFVPAGVGVMLHFGRLADEWPAIVAALVLSTVLAIGVVTDLGASDSSVAGEAPSAHAIATALAPATTPPATSAPRIGTASRRTLSHSRASGTASATTAGPSRKCTNCAPSKYVR